MKSYAGIPSNQPHAIPRPFTPRPLPTIPESIYYRNHAIQEGEMDGYHTTAAIDTVTFVATVRTKRHERNCMPSPPFLRKPVVLYRHHFKLLVIVSSYCCPFCCCNRCASIPLNMA